MFLGYQDEKKIDDYKDWPVGTIGLKFDVFPLPHYSFAIYLNNRLYLGINFFYPVYAKSVFQGY